MSTKTKARKLFFTICQQQGMTLDQARTLLLALDNAGLVIMPHEPTGQLLDASLVAMRRSRRDLPENREEAQRVKHEIRYRAMVERQRESLAVEIHTGREAAAKRAIRSVTSRTT